MLLDLTCRVLFSYVSIPDLSHGTSLTCKRSLQISTVWNIDGIRDLIPRSLYDPKRSNEHWRTIALCTGHWSVGTDRGIPHSIPTVRGYDPLTRPGLTTANTAEALSAAGFFYTGTDLVSTSVQNGTHSTLHIYNYLSTSYMSG